MSLLQRARDSGKCPPALLSEEGAVDEDGFEAAVLKVLDDSGFFLQPEAQVATEFAAILQKVESIDKIPGSTSLEIKKKALDYRRCVLLAVVGSTPTDGASLDRIVADGYLTSVKSWLDDILSCSEGGLDLLLHLLSNIVNLPVTKSSVKESGMGKAIGSIEKHRLCKGTPNEDAIKKRVQQIKDSWNASVKARKPQNAVKEETTAKRAPDSATGESPAAKRTKTEESKKSSSFSSLLKMVSGSPKPSTGKETQANPLDAVASEKEEKKAEAQDNGSEKKGAPSKKTSKRVKWLDHFGGQISTSQLLEGEEVEGQVAAPDVSVSWSDRKKRDRLREKELLAKAKKAKLMDDDDYDIEVKPMQATVSWHQPSLLPERPEVTPAQLTSPELTSQEERMKTVILARYSADYDVPNSPTPLSDVEQALDMTSQASANIASIPFFVPQAAAPAPAAVPTQTAAYPAVSQQSTSAFPPVQSSSATPEFVQMLGLPMFLVGQPVQALQTLASSPGLLSTLVDANGMYDQPRLMNLVQTLNATTGTQPPASPSPYQPPPPNPYSGPPPAASFGQPSSFQGSSGRNGFRGKSDEGNLHLSGYGPGTTEAEIIAAFAPYVHVDEVVMKATFSFVNTSDPVNAQRAKEALTGTLIGGMPVRINNATRKNRDANMSHYGGGGPPARSSFSGSSPGPYGPQGGGGTAPIPQGPPAAPVPPPGGPPATNIESIRDDRGNPATKNLFIAGYGPGTTEPQLRELISQFATVTGVVLKGSFSFVNTTDRAAAVHARQMLGGTTLNGGVLRINFAKETGRLGTSFDLTYGPNTLRGPAPPPSGASMSYYGRGGGR